MSRPSRQRRRSVWLVLLLSVVVGCDTGPPAPAGPGRTPAGATRHLLVVLDGLRPDYVTPALMPNLHALGARGVVFTDHHAVYPTVTRVNAASIATGAYPRTHGLMGNAVFFPAVDPARFLDTSDRDDLLRIETTTDELLTAPTLGEILRDAGHRLLVASAGSSGSSYLLNHRVAGGGIIHYDYALPEALGQEVRGALGPPPPAAMPNADRNRYAVDAFLAVGLDRVDPSVTILWLSDPDTTAHTHGIGAPASDAALRAVDAEIGRIQEGLRAAGRLATFNLWVTSDHGFSTHTGAVDLDALLAPFAGRLDDGSPRIVAGSGAIYVRDGDRATVGAIVDALQRADRVGAIFTRGGTVPGTLPFALAHWDHPRAADILYSPAWTFAENTRGYPGTVASGGTAGHGSASPFDIHNTLIAAGPDLAEGRVVASPSSNVDLAPTWLALLGLDPPSTMEGRVLREALRVGGAAPTVETGDEVVATLDGRYRARARVSRVGASRYLDAASAER